jgi:hypothetical protein
MRLDYNICMSDQTAVHTAGPGKHVLIEMHTLEGEERLEFDIVPDRYADFSLGFLGEGTPLAKVIEGLEPGQAADYHVGDAKLVKVLRVEPARFEIDKEIARRRQEAYRNALDQADRTNAMIFASSFSGKWGDYDPTGFTTELDEEDKKEDEPES